MGLRIWSAEHLNPTLHDQVEHQLELTRIGKEQSEADGAATQKMLYSQIEVTISPDCPAHPASDPKRNPGGAPWATHESCQGAARR